MVRKRRIDVDRMLALRVAFVGVVLALFMVGVIACEESDPEISPAELRELARELKVSPLDTGAGHPDELVALGQALFFDPILSGNRDISCATCHHPDLASGDAVPVSIGTGGEGLGEDRKLGGSRRFIGRNATDLFNRGAPQWHTMFWDSRVEVDVPRGIKSPAGEDLPSGLPNVLVAQAMFPVTSRDEMLGDKDEASLEPDGNELAFLDDEEAIWEALITRILSVDAYADMFAAAFPEIPFDSLTYGHAAIAIAAFESDAFAFADSPFDSFVAGDDAALSDDALAGAALFFGDANCAACHSGALFTDQKNHNIASPQTGPGKEAESPDDFGRFRVTFDLEDLYAFRTPPLRNVELTGPWFHSGSYTSLEEAVRHHIDPAASMESYAQTQSSDQSAALFKDQWSARQFGRSVRDETGAAFAGEFTHVNSDADRTELIKRDIDQKVLEIPDLSDDEVRQIVEFLKSLTDPAARDLSHLIPDSVPSGLPVDR